MHFVNVNLSTEFCSTFTKSMWIHNIHTVSTIQQSVLCIHSSSSSSHIIIAMAIEANKHKFSIHKNILYIEKTEIDVYMVICMASVCNRDIKNWRRHIAFFIVVNQLTKHTVSHHIYMPQWIEFEKWMKKKNDERTKAWMTKG